jgi:hypothetical protein
MSPDTDTPSTPSVPTPADLAALDLSGLARLIRRSWVDPKTKQSRVYFAAAPYLSALASMSTPADFYGADPGRSIVLYFLGNAKTWRGPMAAAIKSELKRRIGVK